MASINSAPNSITQKLGIVCALAMAASVMVEDEQSLAQVSGYHLSAGSRLSSEAQAQALSQIPLLMAFANKIIAQLDHVYTQILAGQISLEKLYSEPFTHSGEIFGRALSQLKELRGTGLLGPQGDAFIILLAELRHKADRNANLIRQTITEPGTYASSIDRDGLVAMARLGQAAAASYRS